MRKNWAYKNSENESTTGLPFIITQKGSDEDSFVPDIGNVKTVGENSIYFYGDVDDDSALELNKTLIELDHKLQKLKVSLGDSYNPIIHLHINTYGGGIFSAFSTVDTIRNLKSLVYTYIDGSVASAGTLITTIGSKRYIGKHAHLPIHQLSSGVYGKFSEMEDEIYNCTNLMKLLKKFYKETTKIPMKNLDELLKRDIWMSAEECLQYGIVDEII